MHSYAKVSFLKAYLSRHKFDIVCLSGTYFDPSVPLHHVNLEIPDYELVRSDHPSQHKRGGVFIYLRNSYPLKILNIHYLQESIRFELQVGSKTCKFVSRYRSPSQTSDDFETFTDKFELTLDTLTQSNSDLIVVLGEFNTKSKNWCINHKTTTEGAKNEFVTSQYGLHQIKNEPTHVSEKSSSCIDLIFTSEPNLVVHSGVLYTQTAIIKLCIQNLT